MTGTQRNLPPVWLLGMTNSPYGLTAGFVVVTVPQMLAAQGISGGKIAAFVATVVWPAVLFAFVSPVLDVRFSRRSYALVSVLLASASIVFSILHRTNVPLIGAVLFCGYMCIALYQGAVGGWMGSLIAKDQDGRLGAWFTVANTAAGGVMMFVGASILRHFSAPVAATIIGVLILLPTLLFLAIPAPGPDRRLAAESFHAFWSDIGRLMKQRQVLVAMVLFVLPSASFALTDMLGGVGADFHAGERVVSLSAGLGSIFAGVTGSLAVAPLSRKWPLRALYLAVGIAGGFFTAMLMFLPRHPVVFALAITGENVFQAMAFAAGTALIFQTMGPGNPLASTLFSVLTSLMCLPIIYMEYIDGKAYDLHGIGGSFAADAGLSIAVCTLLAFWLHRTARPEPRGPLPIETVLNSEELSSAGARSMLK